MYVAIVIGGGPAGLQATLTLGRMHRPTLMLDSGAYRNAPVDAMHNIITNDGRDPAEFRSIVRAELSAYGDVEIRDIAATSIERLPGGTFEVTLADDTVEVGTVDRIDGSGSSVVRHVSDYHKSRGHRP